MNGILCIINSPLKKNKNQGKGKVVKTRFGLAKKTFRNRLVPEWKDFNVNITYTKV